MKTRKMKIFIGVMIGIVVGGVISTSIAVPLIKKNNNFYGGEVYFDGMKFNSTQDRDKYILNNSEKVNQNVVLDEGYFHVNDEGKKIKLDASESERYEKFVNNNINLSYIHSSKKDLISNSNSDFGTISPTWYENSKIENTKNIQIYRGNNDSIYYDKENAINSFSNSGYEFYYFNGIYFSNKDELFNYLVDYYFSDQSNGIKNKNIRIKGPNGKLSDAFNLSDENWKVKASNFIVENCNKVLKLKTNGKNVKYISLSNEKDVIDNISINDIPYVQIDSQNGARNWYVDLNTEDKYILDGPTFFNGFADLEGMNVKENWKIDRNNNVSEIPYKMIVNETINKFFSSYFFDDVSLFTETGKQEDAKAVSENPVLFAELYTTKQFGTFEAPTPEKLPYEDEVFKDFVVKGALPSGKDLVISVNDLISKRVGVLSNSVVSDHSKDFMNFFDNSKYAYIYDEAVSIANSFRTSKNYNFLLKIPLLYYVMMDRLMVAGAEQIFINKTRDFFKSITEIVENLIIDNLGYEAFKPAADRMGFDDLDLAKIYDISLDNSESIDFNLQEISENLSDNYPNLFLLAKMAIILDGKKQTSQTVTMEKYEIIANSLVNTMYPNKSSTFINGCKESLMRSANQLLSKKPSIATSSRYYNSVTNELHFESPIELASYIMSVNYEENTELRDKILDKILEQVNELTTSKKSWSFVPNDNKFKILAYVLQQEKKLKITPQDFLNSINVFDYRSLMFWNNIFVQLEDTLGSSKKYNEYAEIFESFNVDSIDKVKNQDFQEMNNRIIKRQNKEFNETFQGKGGNNSLSIVDGVVLDFPTYASITIMRMLGDIAEENTLFIQENSLHYTKTINPKYKREATLLVKEIIEDKNNINFIPELAILYRGFQTIQESITRNNAMTLNSSSDVNLNIDDMTAIIKNTVQYSSMINQNFDYLKSKLSKIGINTKKGQIIAYSGTTDIENKKRSYDVNLDKFAPIYKNGRQINDHVSLVTDITDDKGNVLETYVIPDMEIKKSIIDYEKTSIANTVYMIPVECWDIAAVNQFDFSFDKYLDISLLPELGINVESLVKTPDGLTLYYNPNYKFDTKYIDFNDNYYFKKWGNWISDVNESYTVYGPNSLKTSYVFYPIRLGEKYERPRRDKIEKVIVKNKEYSYIDLAMTPTVDFYEGNDYSLSGWDYFGYDVDERFNSRLYDMNADLVDNINDMADFYDDKYYRNAHVSGNDYNSSLMILEDIENQTIKAATTAEKPRKKSIISDYVSLNAKNGDNILKPTAEYRDGSSYKPEWDDDFKDALYGKKLKGTYKMPERYMSAFLPNGYEGLASMLTNKYVDDNFIDVYDSFVKRWFANEVDVDDENLRNFSIRDDEFLLKCFTEKKYDENFPEDRKKHKTSIDFMWKTSAEQMTDIYSDPDVVDSFLKENYRWGTKPERFLNELEQKYFQHQKHLDMIDEYKEYMKKVKKRGVIYELNEEFENNGSKYKAVKVVDRNFLSNAMAEARNMHMFLVSHLVGDLNSWNDIGLSEMYRFRLMREYLTDRVTHYTNMLKDSSLHLRPSEKEFIKAQIKYYKSLESGIFVDTKKLKKRFQSYDDDKLVRLSFRRNFKFLLGYPRFYDDFVQPIVREEFNNRVQETPKEDRIVRFNNVVEERIDESINNNKNRIDLNYIQVTPGGVDTPQMVLNTLATAGGASSIVNGGVVIENPDIAAAEGREYNPSDKNKVAKEKSYSDNAIFRRNLERYKKINNNWNNYKAKHSTFFSIMGFFGQIFNIVGFASSIYTLVSMSIMRKTEFSYTYETPEASWSWTGGELWNNMWGNINVTRDISNMKLNKPILINNSYESDYKYFNGKLYTNDNELKNDFVEYILNYSGDVGEDINFSVGYTFDKFDTIVDVESNVDDKKFFSNKEKLKKAVLTSIESDENSQYIEAVIHSYGDKAYDVDWSSLNSDAAKVAAAQSIINKIRPTFVSLIPSVFNDKTGLDTAYAMKRRKLTVLPGNSWDPNKEEVITWEQKCEKDDELPINMDDIFIIDNSANDMNSDGNFIHKNQDGVKKVLDTHKDFVKNKIANMIESITIPNYSGLENKRSFSEIIEENMNNRIEKFNVYSYYDNSSSIVYFVDTFDKNGNIIKTALENLNDYVSNRNGVFKEYITQETKFLKYKGEYFKSIDEILKRFN